jgi:hypothetical protein
MDFMVSVLSSKILTEEQTVAELALLGIRYLSQATDTKVDHTRPGEQLLADLVRQPSSRVRTAVIALLLEHPEYAAFIPAAVAKLRGSNRIALKLFYTAAVFLQRKYYLIFQELQGQAFQWLPDIFSAELGIPSDLSDGECLVALGLRHQALTGKFANWAGTYNNVACLLLRRRQMETGWNQ